MNETEYHKLADKTLEAIADALEDADAKGQLELEQQGGVLTIALSGGKQFVVSKHAPSQQVWLSSPVSGGLHFSYDGAQWALADGRVLEMLLYSELGVVA